MNTVSTKEVDYLEEDPQIRGQNYALISFISPEDVLKNKECFFFSQFINQFSKDMNTLFAGIESKYPESNDLINTIKSNHSYIFNSDDMDEQYKFFKSVNLADMDDTFYKNNNFTTSIRGIKVRGVFDTIDEAKNRSEFLKRLNNNFDIYIAQVGCWCPFSPNPNDINNQEYGETQLNTLMKQYNKNVDDKNILFEKRKNEQVALGAENAKKNTSNDVVIDELSDKLDNIGNPVNTWSQAKNTII